MTEAELARYLADIEQNRGGEVRVVFERTASLDTDPSRILLDRFARGCGLAPLGDAWLDISRSDAYALVIGLLARDLAYNAEEMPTAVATELAAQFFAVFGDGTRFFTNTSLRVEASHPDTALSYSWNPLTTATFDAGVFGIGSRWIGAIVVQDED